MGVRNAKKAFDFDSDSLFCLFGCQKAFCSKINVNILVSPFEYQRIMTDCPPILLEYSPNSIMIFVFPGHDLVYGLCRLDTDTDPTKRGISRQIIQLEFVG
jgi:hypothetical protein